jgi:adenylate cyclase
MFALSQECPNWVTTLCKARFSHTTDDISACDKRRVLPIRRVRFGPECRSLYKGDMNEKFFSESSVWLIQAGLAGRSETDIVSGFCDRCVTAGIPLGRAHVFIDTLHPVHEGSLFRWGYGPEESPVHEYGRTSLGGLDASSPVSLDLQATDIWQRSPFHHLLQSGASLLRRRVDAATKDEFSLLPDWLEAGMTDYVAINTRFAAENVLGEMDGVYSSWGTGAPDGFSDAHIGRLNVSRLTWRWPSNRFRSRV